MHSPETIMMMEYDSDDSQDSPFILDLTVQDMLNRGLFLPFHSTFTSLHFDLVQASLQYLDHSNDDQSDMVIMQDSEWKQEKLEANKKQLAFLKRMRKRNELIPEQDRIVINPIKTLPYLENEFILSRATKSIKTFTLPQDQSARSQIPRSVKRMIKSLMPASQEILIEDDETLKRLQTIPEIDVALDLKLTATRDQTAFFKSAFQKDKRARRGHCDTENDTLASYYDAPMFTRSQSPPIFPRPATVARSTFNTDLLDEIRHESHVAPISSPPSAAFNMKEWNKLEHIQPVPSSISDHDEPLERPMWPTPLKLFSTPSGDPGFASMEIERPLFPRVKVKVEAHDYVLRPSLQSAYPDQEIDELASGDEIDELAENYLTKDLLALIGNSSPSKQQSFHDVMRALDSDVPFVPSSVLLQARLDIPDLSLEPLTMPIPTMASFSSTSDSIWSLKKLPGLRSLLIELSWEAWTLPENESIFTCFTELGGVEQEEFERYTKRAKQVEDNFENTLVDAGQDIDFERRFDLSGDWSRYDESEADEEIIGRANITSTQVDEQMSTMVQEESTESFLSIISSTIDVDSVGRGVDSNATELDDSASRCSASVDFIYPSSSSLVVSSPISSHQEQRSLRDDTISIGVEGVPSIEPVESVDLTTVDIIEGNRTEWSQFGALAFFLSSRGRKTEAQINPAPVPSNPISRISDPTAIPRPSAVKQPRPDLPFLTPGFVNWMQSQHGMNADVEEQDIRIVASTNLMQHRSLYQALRSRRLVLIDRPFDYLIPPPLSTPFAILAPHLLLNPTTGVIFVPLFKLMGSAVATNGTDSIDDPQQLTKQEAVFDSIKRLTNSSYRNIDRLIIVLQEFERTTGGKVRPSDYTPPVMNGLKSLHEAIEGLKRERRNDCTFEVVFSESMEYSARLMRACVVESRSSDTHGGIWEGNREWLTDDPTNDEISLLRFAPYLNPFSASAILSRCTFDAFATMERKERKELLGDICGFDRIDLISDYLELQPRSPSPQYLASLSAIGLSDDADEFEHAVDGWGFQDMIEWE